MVLERSFSVSNQALLARSEYQLELSELRPVRLADGGGREICVSAGDALQELAASLSGHFIRSISITDHNREEGSFVPSNLACHSTSGRKSSIRLQGQRMLI